MSFRDIPYDVLLNELAACKDVNNISLDMLHYVVDQAFERNAMLNVEEHAYDIIESVIESIPDLTIDKLSFELKRLIMFKITPYPNEVELIDDNVYDAHLLFDINNVDYLIYYNNNNVIDHKDSLMEITKLLDLRRRAYKIINDFIKSVKGDVRDIEGLLTYIIGFKIVPREEGWIERLSRDEIISFDTFIAFKDNDKEYAFIFEILNVIEFGEQIIAFTELDEDADDEVDNEVKSLSC